MRSILAMCAVLGVLGSASVKAQSLESVCLDSAGQLASLYPTMASFLDSLQVKGTCDSVTVSRLTTIGPITTSVPFLIVKKDLPCGLVLDFIIPGIGVDTVINTCTLLPISAKLANMRSAESMLRVGSLERSRVEINYHLTGGVKEASILIVDLAGRQVGSERKISGAGVVSFRNPFAAGRYLVLLKAKSETFVLPITLQ